MNYEDDEYPCGICGKWADECHCPACPECHVTGDPGCLRDHNLLGRVAKDNELLTQHVAKSSQNFDDLADFATKLLFEKLALHDENRKLKAHICQMQQTAAVLFSPIEPYIRGNVVLNLTGMRNEDVDILLDGLDAGYKALNRINQEVSDANLEGLLALYRPVLTDFRNEYHHRQQNIVVQLWEQLSSRGDKGQSQS